MYSFFFFFNDTATTEIYTLSLHDALPILFGTARAGVGHDVNRVDVALLVLAFERLKHFVGNFFGDVAPDGDRKSTRLNSSHGYISYAVFCLKKKKKTTRHSHTSNMTAATI